MAASLVPTTTASASAHTTDAGFRFQHSRFQSTVLSFRLTSLPKLQFLSRHLNTGRNCSMVLKAQQNQVSDFEWFQLEDVFSNLRSFFDMLLEPFVDLKVSVDGSSNDVAAPSTSSEVPSMEAKDSIPESEPSPPALATEESISEFLAQVSSLVKLVNSKDIVELELKQLGCELVIRKKEALPQPPAPAPVMMMHSSPPPALAQPAFQPAPPAAAQATSSRSLSSPAPAASATKSAKSSLPPLKCPMAGTFYRYSGPGEPPFIKVGDKVQKGQVICIIEAMKLMNEIEFFTHHHRPPTLSEIQSFTQVSGYEGLLSW